MAWKAISIMLLLLPRFAEGAEWKMYGGTNYGTSYYDRQSVRSISGDIKRFLTKNVIEAENHLRDLTENLEKRSLPSDGYGINTASKQLLEINCSSNKLRTLHFSVTNAEGAVMFSESYNNPEWKHIAPESVWDKLSKTICPPKKK